MIHKNHIKTLLFIAIYLFLFQEIISKNLIQDAQTETTAIIFNKFENGMRTGAVKEFSTYFDFETYISLESGVTSYYSKDQSYYILKEFLSKYKPIRFKYIRIHDIAEMPFAVGQFTYSLNGVKGTSQVFISLKNNGSGWKISQITIN